MLAPDILQDIRKAYEDGSLIVFAGPGVSVEGGLPTRRRIAEILRDRLQRQGASRVELEEIDSSIERDRIADALAAIELALQPNEFRLAVQGETDDQAKEVPSIATAITALRPKLRAVLTTNLDRLLDRAFKGEWESVSSFSGDIAQRKPSILHLHGKRSEPADWIVTREQYEKWFVSPTHRGIFETLYRTYPILFIGCDFEDEFLDRALMTVRATACDEPPSHFALMPREIRPHQRKKLEKIGLRLLPRNGPDGSRTDDVELLRALAGPSALATAATRSSQLPRSRPQILIAGPCFGLSPDAAADVRRLCSEGLSLDRRARIAELLRRAEVEQAQIDAIIRHDLVIDLSPWRAFARWRSDGLRELEPGRRVDDDTPLVIFAFANEAGPEASEDVPAALDRLQALWPWVRAWLRGRRQPRR